MKSKIKYLFSMINKFCLNIFRFCLPPFIFEEGFIKNALFGMCVCVCFFYEVLECVFMKVSFYNFPESSKIVFFHLLLFFLFFRLFFEIGKSAKSQEMLVEKKIKFF